MCLSGPIIEPFDSLCSQQSWVQLSLIDTRLWCGFLMVQLLPYWVIYVTFMIVKWAQVMTGIQCTWRSHVYLLVLTGKCPFFWEERAMCLLNCCTGVCKISMWLHGHACVVWSVGCIWKIMLVKVACRLSLPTCAGSSVLAWAAFL